MMMRLLILAFIAALVGLIGCTIPVETEVFPTPNPGGGETSPAEIATVSLGPPTATLIPTSVPTPNPVPTATQAPNPNPTPAFAPTPAGTKPFTFVVYGDSGIATQSQFDVPQQIENIRPDFLLHTGDVVYTFGEAENYDPRFFAPYQNTLKRAPMFPSIGNHDYYTDDAQPYIVAFYLPMNSFDGSERFYFFDYGNSHFVSLEVQCEAPNVCLTGTPQYKWLVSDLASSNAFLKFVFFHGPPYSTGANGSNAGARSELSPLFEKYEVDQVFNGHDHAYVRTESILDFEAEGKGVVYIVTGGGGQGLYKLGQADFVPVSESAFHVTKVTITGQLLELTAIRSDGSTMDSLTIDRRE